MTDERAAEILREIAQQNLPTVNSIPFPEIKAALMRGADALEPFSLEEGLRETATAARQLANDLFNVLYEGGAT